MGNKIKILTNKMSLLSLLDSKLAETLRVILTQVNTDTYKWYSTTTARQEISVRCGISIPSVNRYITRLREKDILTQQPGSSRGEYTINRKIIEL